MVPPMRAIDLAVLCLALSACSSGKSGNPVADAAPGSGGSGSGSGSSGMDASPPGDDAPQDLPDAPGPPVGRPLYAVADTALYKIDVDALTATEVADITIANTVVDAIDGLGFDGTSLIALDQGGANVLVIDPDTAQVQVSKALSESGLAGLTVIPAADNPTGHPVYLAASGSTLYRITPATGHVDAVGDFSNGATFHTDLAWVHGRGLYITLDIPGSGGGPGPTNGGVGLVKIDPASAATQQLVRFGFDNINGLSGYRGALWGVSSGGNVYQIDATGMLSRKLMGGPAYTEAAE